MKSRQMSNQATLGTQINSVHLIDCFQWFEDVELDVYRSLNARVYSSSVYGCKLHSGDWMSPGGVMYRAPYGATNKKSQQSAPQILLD